VSKRKKRKSLGVSYKEPGSRQKRESIGLIGLRKVPRLAKQRAGASNGQEKEGKGGKTPRAEKTQRDVGSAEKRGCLNFCGRINSTKRDREREHLTTGSSKKPDKKTKLV